MSSLFRVILVQVAACRQTGGPLTSGAQGLRRGEARPRPASHGGLFLNVATNGLDVLDLLGLRGRLVAQYAGMLSVGGFARVPGLEPTPGCSA